MLSCSGFALILNFKVFVVCFVSFSCSLTFPVKSWILVPFLWVMTNRVSQRPSLTWPRVSSSCALAASRSRKQAQLDTQTWIPVASGHGYLGHPDTDTCGTLAGRFFLLWVSWSFNMLRVKVLKTNYALQKPCSVLSNPGEPIHPERNRLQSAEPWCLHWERLSRTLHPPHLANKEAELWGEEESDRGWR